MNKYIIHNYTMYSVLDPSQEISITDYIDYTNKRITDKNLEYQLLQLKSRIIQDTSGVHIEDIKPDTYLGRSISKLKTLLNIYKECKQIITFLRDHIQKKRTLLMEERCELYNKQIQYQKQIISQRNNYLISGKHDDFFKLYKSKTILENFKNNQTIGIKSLVKIKDSPNPLYGVIIQQLEGDQYRVEHSPEDIKIYNIDQLKYTKSIGQQLLGVNNQLNSDQHIEVYKIYDNLKENEIFSCDGVDLRSELSSESVKPVKLKKLSKGPKKIKRLKKLK